MKSEFIAVSDVLKKAREDQGLSVKAVAKDICVQSGYLKAIEAGDYDKLPAQTFAVGFVRSYASALGQDADHIVANFKEESGIKSLADSVSAKPQHAKTPKKVPSWLSPIAGLVGASFCWMVWGGSFSAPMIAATTSASVEQEKAQLAALSVNLVADRRDEAAVETIVPTERIEDTVTVEHQRSFFIPAAYADTPKKLDINTAALVKANEASWIRVSREDGTEIWTGILKAGQQYVPDEATELFLTTSNAGGLLVLGASGEFTQLGSRGEIVKNSPMRAPQAMADATNPSGSVTGSR
jgi:cytoskeleton protein RodZ